MASERHDQLCQCGHVRNAHGGEGACDRCYDEMGQTKEERIGKCPTFRPVAPSEPPAADSPTPGAETCTCPSGDGSLRWPCPAHMPAPTLANWSETCDWGHCNGPSYAVRWADDLRQWLAVCRKHRAKTVVLFDDLPEPPAASDSPTPGTETRWCRMCGARCGECGCRLGGCYSEEWWASNGGTVSAAPSPVAPEPPAEVQQDDERERIERGAALGMQAWQSGYEAGIAARPSADTETLRDVLLKHHPIAHTLTGPLKGCRCGQVKIGQDVIAHVVGHVRAALDAR